MNQATAKPRVVVVGCGFGGLEAVRALSRAEVEITLVDRTISVLSIIVLGSIVYAISPKRRGLGVSAAPAT